MRIKSDLRFFLLEEIERCLADCLASTGRRGELEPVYPVAARLVVQRDVVQHLDLRQRRLGDDFQRAFFRVRNELQAQRLKFTSNASGGVLYGRVGSLSKSAGSVFSRWK